MFHRLNGRFVLVRGHLDQHRAGVSHVPKLTVSKTGPDTFGAGSAIPGLNLKAVDDSVGPVETIVAADQLRVLSAQDVGQMIGLLGGETVPAFGTKNHIGRIVSGAFRDAGHESGFSPFLFVRRFFHCNRASLAYG